MGSLPVSHLTRPPGDPHGHYTLRTLSGCQFSLTSCGKAWLCSVCLLRAASHRQASVFVSSTRSVFTGETLGNVNSVHPASAQFRLKLSWVKWICLTSWPIPKRFKQWWKKKRLLFGFCGRECDFANNDISYFISGVAEKGAPCPPEVAAALVNDILWFLSRFFKYFV